MEPSLPQAATIEKIEFSRATYHLIENFRCGDDPSARLAEDWLKGVPPDNCAFHSIEKYGTRVWIYQLQDCVVGFGSLGPNKADGESIAFVPMLAVASAFQGAKAGSGIKYSHHILSDLIQASTELHMPRICLLVSEDNHRAVKLYSNFGFVKFGGKMKYNNIRMCKCLKEGNSPA